jgi:hypothetical protein
LMRGLTAAIVSQPLKALLMTPVLYPARKSRFDGLDSQVILMYIAIEAC